MGNLIQTDGCETVHVKYADDDATIARVYEKMLKWFIAQGAYSGEIIWQSDRCMERAPEILTELAEEVFKFDVDYEYDDEEEKA
jgi:hypothetical protein